MCKERFKASPLGLLIHYTSVCVLLFMDRGALSSVITRIKSDSGLGINSLEAGSLGSVFLLGFIIFGPVFASFSQHLHSEYLISIGLTIWCGSMVMTGLSFNFLMLLSARALTGIGQACLFALAPACILEKAPPAKKNLWIGIFLSGNNIGFAIGQNYGSQISNSTGVWYYPFLIEPCIMLPFVIWLVLRHKDPALFLKKSNGLKEGFSAQFKTIFDNSVFIFISLGLSSCYFTLTANGFWVIYKQCPNYIESHYGVSSSKANIVLAVILIIDGVLGNVCGSMLLNRHIRKIEETCKIKNFSDEIIENNRIQAACKLISRLAGIGLVFLCTGSLLGNLYAFLGFLAAGQFFLFLCFSPCSIIVMGCFPRHLRGQANAFFSLIANGLGALWAPIGLGGLFNEFGYYWGMVLNSAWPIWSVVLWTIAWNLSVTYIVQ